MQELNQNKYFNVVIKNNSYYIEESINKPDCAVKTLSNIEKVFKDNLAYDTNHRNSFSPLPKEKITELLQEKTKLIHEGYEKKEWTLLHIIRRLFGQDKQIRKLHTRIDNYRTEPNQLPLIVKNAIAYGYDGENVEEARLYTKKLFSEIELLGQMGLINVPDKSLLHQKSFIESQLKPENIGRTCINLLKNLDKQWLWLGSSNFIAITKYVADTNFVYIYKYFSKLFKENPNPQLIEKIGPSALLIAARIGNVPAANFLLQIGADINYKNNKNFTPLINSIISENKELVEILIQKADVNVSGPEATTPLMYAARFGMSEIIKLLLDNNANPNMQNINGDTALSIARSWEHRNSANLIHEALNKHRNGL